MSLLLVPLTSTSPAVASDAAPPANCSGLDGATSSADVTSPVVQSARLEQSPGDPAHLATLGFHVEQTPYPQSVAITWDLRFVPQRQVSCATTVGLRTYSVHEGLSGTPLEARLIDPSVGETRVVSMAADLPADEDVSSGGPCIALDIVLRDRSGSVVQTAPSNGPVLTCAGLGQEYTFGG